MFIKDITIPNRTGLHARPASGLVRLCKSFKSDIRIIWKDTVIDGKNIIQVLSGGLNQYAEIRLEIAGDDEDEAGAKITAFIESLTE